MTLETIPVTPAVTTTYVTSPVRYTPAVVGKLAENLLVLRGEMTQEDAAKAIGVSQSQYSKWENGVVPEIGGLLKIAVGFKVSVDRVLLGCNPEYDQLWQTSVKNAGNAPHHPEVLRLSSRIAELERDLSAAKNVIDSIGGLLTAKPDAGDKTRPSDRHASGRRGHNRNAG